MNKIKISQKSSPSPVGPSPIRQIRLVDRYTRRHLGYYADTTSLPGHLIQLTLTGISEHEIGGRRYTMKPGTLTWFHEDEYVRVNVTTPPWSFYTLNFIAPTLEPPPFERRARQVGVKVRKQFSHVLAAWRKRPVDPFSHAMCVHAEVLKLLAQLPGGYLLPYQTDPATALWWSVETMARRNLSQPIALLELAERSGKSIASITRACRRALGTTPMKRLKQVRMSYAQDLVRRSDQSITRIALSLGFPRIHEFSRDYTRYFGCSPTADRNATRMGTADRATLLPAHEPTEALRQRSSRRTAASNDRTSPR